MTFDFAPIAVLSFDCYGTLIDWERGILTALAEHVPASLFDGKTEAILRAFAKAESAEERRTPGKPYPLILEATYLRMSAELGWPAELAAAQAFGSSVGDWPAFADTTEALRRLQKRFRLAVLSNVDHGSFARSERLLGVSFDLVVTAFDVGTYKPNPRNFHMLLERLDGMDLRKDQLLHVAQSLYHDHVPAQALGLPTCWIDRRGGQGGGATREAVVTPTMTFGSLKAFADTAL
jgi:2-haloalkanoic acid dehalogenase type II